MILSWVQSLSYIYGRPIGGKGRFETAEQYFTITAAFAAVSRQTTIPSFYNPRFVRGCADMTLLRLRTPFLLVELGVTTVLAVVFSVAAELLFGVAVALFGVVVFFFVTGGVVFSGTDVFLSGAVPALSGCGAG